MEEKNNNSKTKFFLGLTIGIIIGIILCFAGVCLFASIFGINTFKDNAIISTEAVTEKAIIEEDNKDENEDKKEADTQKENSEEETEETTVETTVETTLAEENAEIASSTEKAIPISPVKVYEWEENRIYDTDHQAIYKGKLYRAKWNNLGNRPDESGEYGVWELLGDA